MSSSNEVITCGSRVYDKNQSIKVQYMIGSITNTRFICFYLSKNRPVIYQIPSHQNSNISKRWSKHCWLSSKQSTNDYCMDTFAVFNIVLILGSISVTKNQKGNFISYGICIIYHTVFRRYFSLECLY